MLRRRIAGPRLFVSPRGEARSSCRAKASGPREPLDDRGLEPPGRRRRRRPVFSPIPFTARSAGTTISAAIRNGVRSVMMRNDFLRTAWRYSRLRTAQILFMPPPPFAAASISPTGSMKISSSDGATTSKRRMRSRAIAAARISCGSAPARAELGAVRVDARRARRPGSDGEERAVALELEVDGVPPVGGADLVEGARRGPPSRGGSGRSRRRASRPRPSGASRGGSSSPPPQLLEQAGGRARR